jgi:8-oxo-dGTP pyrophosphatase MutT (NUDIX family)
MLLRDCPKQNDVEVLLLRRHHDLVFGGGMYVFPGGRLDQGDAGPIEELCDGLTDAVASSALGLPQGGLAFWIAAIRECYEEAGILLAKPLGAKGDLDLGDPVLRHRYTEARKTIHDHSLSFAEFCRNEELQLTTSAMRYVSHWATPIGAPRRFNTRFFMARSPLGQEPLHDNSETIDCFWMRPTLAIERERQGDLSMMEPTVASLQFLATFRSVDDALQSPSGYEGDISSLAP